MPSTLDIIVAFGGPDRTIKIAFTRNEPISILLNRIQDAQPNDGIPIIRHDIFINGVHIKDTTKSLAHYRVLGRTLTFRDVKASPPNQNTFSVKVMTPNGTLISLTCAAGMLVQDVKDMIQAQEGISIDNQTLLHGVRQIEDFRDLKFYGITEPSSLQLLMPLPASYPGIVFTDGLDGSFGPRKIQFSPNAPRGRVATPGLNVECQCACTATHNVIVQKGLGIFEVDNPKLTCPNCGQTDKITPIAFGFFRCQYRLHGLLRIGGRQNTTAWAEVTADDCYVLMLTAHENIACFRQLVIETTCVGQFDPCTACLHPLNFSETLPCGHRFHLGCKKQWEGVCPNCQYNVVLWSDAAPLTHPRV
ncbi:hypothetical protein BGX30_013555 [Mortierella sp. GBA39]|nr:hypothetical protein BGX30_013555 [Mortierella sp. GBA39]